MSVSDYRSSGVDLDAMGSLKERIKAFATATHGPEVLNPDGDFAGLYRLSGYTNPVLVASTDGVGTKLQIASHLGHYESIGQDLVTLNVNDILTRGAKPLFFLDYVAFSHLDAQMMDTLMRGIVWGCREVGCALVGGETAQLPGTYGPGEMELAGFVVGVVEAESVLSGDSVEPGDHLVGIPSSGLHTNGYSLVRRVFGIDQDPSVLFRFYDELNHQLGEELLIRHRCYYPLLAPVLGVLKGLAHITGAGIPGKVPPVLPAGLSARFRAGSWPVPPIFDLIQRVGNVSPDEMYRVFNMGLGMVAICSDDNLALVQEKVPDAVVVGDIIEMDGEDRVTFSDG